MKLKPKRLALKLTCETQQIDMQDFPLSPAGDWRGLGKLWLAKYGALLKHHETETQNAEPKLETHLYAKRR